MIVRTRMKMADAKSAAEAHYRERILEALEVVDE